MIRQSGTANSFADGGAAVEGWAAQIASMSTGLTWHVKEDSWGGCSGDYANTAGVHAYIYVVFNGPVPEEVWPQALDVVRRGAAQLGAINVTTPVDRPRPIMMSSSPAMTACQSNSAPRP